MTHYYMATIGGENCGHHHRTYQAALQCALPVMRETYHSANPTITDENGDEIGETWEHYTDENGDEIGETWEHYKNRWINDTGNSPVIEYND